MMANIQQCTTINHTNTSKIQYVMKSLTIEHSLINERRCDCPAIIVQSSYQLALFLLRHRNADRLQVSQLLGGGVMRGAYKCSANRGISEASLMRPRPMMASFRLDTLKVTGVRLQDAAGSSPLQVRRLGPLVLLSSWWPDRGFRLFVAFGALPPRFLLDLRAGIRV